MDERVSKRYYALQYFIAFGLVAFFVGFLPLHCRSLNFDAFQISLVMACGNLSAMLCAPFFMRTLARYISPAAIVRLCSGSSLAALFILFFAEGFIFYISIIFIFMFFLNGLLVLVDAHALHQSIGGNFRFEQLRLWGSIGFIVFSFLFGVFIDWTGNGSILVVATVIAVCVCGTSALVVKNLSSGGIPPSGAAALVPDSGALLLRYVRFVLVVALSWASHAALYVYFSLYLQALNLSATMISLAWGLSVAAETLMLLKFHLIEKRLRLLVILQVSLLLTILRWILLWISESTIVIFIAQSLHAFSFASFHIASMKFIYRSLPENERVSGQAVLVTWGGGAGSLCGRIGVGWLAGSAMSIADYRSLFLISAAVAAVSLLICSGLREPTADAADSK